MCQYKSAIVLRDEKCKGGFQLLFSPWTESHDELCIIHKLLVNDKKLQLAKVEFSPASMDKAHLIDEYKLTIDEERTPDWFDKEMQEKVTNRLRNYIKSIIVDGDVELLIGGQFVIAPSAKIQCARSMVISAIWGGTVNAIWGGTVNEICGGTVNEIWGGTVNEIRGGTVNAIRGGTVNEIWGGTVNVHSGAIIVKDNRPKK